MKKLDVKTTKLNDIGAIIAAGLTMAIITVIFLPSVISDYQQVKLNKILIEKAKNKKVKVIYYKKDKEGAK